MKKCHECGKELHNGDVYILDCYDKIICSDCYDKIPYTAYEYRLKGGDFIGISQDTVETEIYEGEDEDE